MVKNQIFGSVTEQIGDAFEGVPFAGIIGLGSAKLSVANSVPLFDNMKDLGLIKQKLFAVYMTDVLIKLLAVYLGLCLEWRGHFRPGGDEVHGRKL